MGEGGSISERADPHWPQLLLCVVLAPVLSAIFYGLAGRLAGFPSALIMWSPVVWMFVLFYGLIPSLLFGGVGCILAERFLSTASMAAWSGAGALTASAYVAASLGAAALGLEAVGFFAPWKVVEAGKDALGMGGWAAPICIILSGFFAGAFYRWMSKPRTSRVSTRG
ncbi:hypothetical protein [Brevundimonas naejangsanensis]|uniref:hypothetical protein n=1 Tax=Brevundimonas naejangsanensis TaxID=588932 RepID=UPI000ECC997E|nr:hypothetical protein [Brevundimonas naejangsanensis]HAC01286.1 hypothetical protein [Brevundimonas sp.]